MDPESASLEDITALLNYYNGKPVLINGIATYPFNDPVTAAKLNNKYYELTGIFHPVFVKEAPIKINELMKMKKMFYGCSKLSYLNLDNFKTVAINNMSYVFYEFLPLFFAS